MNAVDELNLLLGIGPSRPQLPLTLRKSGYVPVRSLGKGSYGQAFLVYHEPKKQYYVVKHLNLAGMSSSQRHNAHNEINILQKLHHPNIVRYVEYYEEHPHLYIVMEYADGGDVYSLLSSAQTARKLAVIGGYRGGAAVPTTGQGTLQRSVATSGLLSEAQVVSLFVQTTMAVRYMHDRRLLHRDIKSSNIFLTKNHVVKLGDFGISTVLQSTVAMASTMCGTPCYFSPELCQGRPYNSKSDMWALGVLLYELCAGHVPFESTSMKALMRVIVHKQPSRIPAVYSEELWLLIVQLLQKDARRRPDAGQVLMSPVLMRHVPDLIQQLADDTAYDGSSVLGSMGGAFMHDSSKAAAAAAAVASPPPPPPRGVQQALPSPTEAKGEGAAGLSPSAAVPDARSVVSSPVQIGGKEVPSAPSRAQRQRQPAGGDGSGEAGAGASSILQLLARFDAQKQQIAEARQRKRDNQDGLQGPPVTSGIAKGSPAEGAARLSPGAVAALQQQGRGKNGAGRDSPGLSRRISAEGVSAGAASAVPSRSPFLPPPIPLSLREVVAADRCRPDALPTTSSPPSGGRENGLAMQAPIVAGARPALQAHNGHSSSAAARAQLLPVRTERRRCNDPLRDGSQPPRVSSNALPAAGELSAVLSELSSWQERSVRRQLRHSGQRQSRDGMRGKSDAEATPCPEPLKEVPLLSSLGSTSAGTTSKAAEEKVVTTLSRRSAEHTQGLDVEGCATNQGQQSNLMGGAGQTENRRGVDEGKSVPRDVAVCSDTKARVSSGERANVNVDVEEDEDSTTLSFVDVLGTALDVDAVQAASAAAQQEQQRELRGMSALPLPTTSPEKASVTLSLSGRMTFFQVSPRLTTQGAGVQIDAQHPTARADAILHSTPSATSVFGEAVRGAGATVDTGGSAGEGSDDVGFTTSCLCGRAVTSNGFLSMIYGSFICSCDVCIRLTGATHGVEWLHLPEVTHGLSALLSSRAPSEAPSGGVTTKGSSAGTGAAAAVVLRAQAGGTPQDHSLDQGALMRGRGSGTPAPHSLQSPRIASPCSSAANSVQVGDGAAAALTQANIRAYVHRLIVAPSPQVTSDRHQGTSHTSGYKATAGDGGVAAATHGAVWTIYTCVTCGALVGMQHDGVEGLLLPMITLDAQSLDMLSSCAQAVEHSSTEASRAG